jgi:outer membrane protein OmpA-like peptidoglycan-associated protein
MPPSINTLGNERFPTAYNDTLFFSSDFFLGLGGLDIFKTYLRSDNSWSTPENVGIPFNSSYDDFGLIISPFVKDYVAMEGYFSSDRAGAGKDDIYYFVKRSEQKVKTEKEPEVEDETEEELEVMTILSIKVTEKSFAIENDPNSLVLGQRPVENATLIVQDSKERKTLKTDSKGNVLLEIQPDSFYQFLAGKKDYLNSKATFSMSESDITISEGVQTFNLRMEIERIFPEVEITLDNIYYDFNESFIREDAKPALNHLFQILANNPTVQIQLSSHTDCQGDDDYNDALSQRRAESAIQYIISQGIDPTRISAVGYGESRLAIECICDDCTEDEHQMNRRTTFMVVQ